MHVNKHENLRVKLICFNIAAHLFLSYSRHHVWEFSTLLTIFDYSLEIYCEFYLVKFSCNTIKYRFKNSPCFVRQCINFSLRSYQVLPLLLCHIVYISRVHWERRVRCHPKFYWVSSQMSISPFNWDFKLQIMRHNWLR